MHYLSVFCYEKIATSDFHKIPLFYLCQSFCFRANIKSEFCYKEMSEKANSTYLNALAMGNPLKLTYEGLYKNMTADCTVKHFLSKVSNCAYSNTCNVAKQIISSYW